MKIKTYDYASKRVLLNPVLILTKTDMENISELEMYFALVYYPGIEQQEFHVLRNKYEPNASLLPEHLVFLFKLEQVFKAG